MKPTATYLSKRLLAWFDRHGRKNLPWQINKTPYRVWVSEIMLQQTQVATVIPYFERFMQTFPDIGVLAKAKDDTVLHLWAGLGYYSRARNLHQTAKIICQEHQGQFPDTLDVIKSLPGIGISTAGAIMAIAYQQPTPILDGNVKRVLSRLYGITDPINDKATETILWEYANNHTPKKRAADYTQAIMDLGATLCTRREPACIRCPFKNHCVAYEKNLVTEIPAKRTTKKIPTKEATFLVIKQGRAVLLQKRPARGIWGSLFSFPELSGLADTKTIRTFCKNKMNLATPRTQALTSFRHTFSHYHLQIHPILLEIRQANVGLIEENDQIWYNLDKPGKIGLPKPVQAILRELS